eukprot:4857329-Pyramimonas_sp.AAC.1
MMQVTPSACRPPTLTQKLITAGGTLMAMVRARPPKPRCRAAACWEGVILRVVTLIQACTSRTNSRKRTRPAGPQ